MAEFLSLRQSAAKLGVHHATLSRAVKRGELEPEFVTPGGVMRFSPPAVERYRRQRLQPGRRRPSPNALGQAYGHVTDGIDDAPGVDELLEAIPAISRSLVGAQYAALAVMDDTGNIIRFVTSGMSDELRAAIGSLPTGRGLLGVMYREGKPVRMPDISRDPRSTGVPDGHPVLTSFMGVPITLQGATLGTFYFANKIDAPEFTEQDQRIVEMLAQCAASAVENARLYYREAGLRQAAESERARLRAIIDASAAAVIVADAEDGRVVLANREASRILGQQISPGNERSRYERAVVYRRSDGSAFELNELPLQRALQEGAVSRGVEVIFEFPDGRRLPTVVNAAPVYDDAGRISAGIAVFEDITALQQVEQLKAEFLSMVSHDLRGPLSTIKGMSSGLLIDSAPRDMNTMLDYINSIDEEADRMSELVSNLLDMSRIGANSMPMDPEVCHLADIVGETVQQIERSRLGGQNRIKVDVPLELPEMYADYDQLGRVFTNLLSNALKYSGPESEVRVRSYLDAEDKQTIVTEVSDSGVGIPANEIDKIFDRFYRVTSQRGRGRPGSGLGLAICKAIVEAHEGKIWVESDPGKGSTFYMSLPISVASVGL